MVARSRGLAYLALCSAVLLAGSDYPLESAHAKIERIENDRAAPGSRITMTSAELTAYAREQAEAIAPGAVHAAVLTISAGRAEATATINFLKLRSAEGANDGWLMQKLLDGERPVRIVVTIASSNGRARVDVERVEISGVVVEGRSLDFLLRQFVVPSFPDARVDDWFALGHHIDRLSLRAGAADVFIFGQAGTTI